MSRPRRLIAFILSCCLPFSVAVVTARAWRQASSNLAVDIVLDPAAFLEENVGQYGDGARYSMATGSGRLWLAEVGLWLSVLEAPQNGEHWPASGSLRGVHLHLSFAGAGPEPQLEPFGAQPVHISYLRGQDPKGWRADVPAWSGVRYRDLYPGIDLVVEPGASRALLPWRLEARPGADLDGVRLRIEGAQEATIAGSRLNLATAVGEISLALPAAAGGRPDQPAAGGSIVRTADATFEVTSLFDFSAAAGTEIPAIDAADLIYSTISAAAIGISPTLSPSIQAATPTWPAAPRRWTSPSHLARST